MSPAALASLSDALLSASIAVYSVALVGYCAELAFGRRAKNVAGSERQIPAAAAARHPATAFDDSAAVLAASPELRWDRTALVGRVAWHTPDAGAREQGA